LRAYDLEQHRRMMADLAKRSRYFLVNPGKFNRPEETGGVSEFGHRYFEGAAPGTVMLGEIPRNKEFKKIFNWEDAVIHLPFDSEDIGAVMKQLDREPERQMTVRRTNMIQSLLHFDWVYRWESILQIAGLSAIPALYKRKQMLAQRAAMLEEALMEPNVALRQ
jgi:hypothetical protein